MQTTMSTEVEYLIADTETASFEGGIVDLAVVAIDTNFNVKWQVESLIDPERPIKFSAMGIHHITQEMVQHEPTMAEFVELHGNPFDRTGLVVGGHNVAFDCRMLSGYLPQSYRTVCTYRLARNLWPDSVEDHKLQTLRYTFGLEAGPAHRAMGDVITCISLLKHMGQVVGTDMAGLTEMAKKPLSLDSKMSFGKHKGERLKDLPAGYVSWLLNSKDLDPDLREALSSRKN